ncbi:MAG: DNA polymerase III subunit alpha [Acidobacteria bacterium]|nr:DNA polymerase III subunit alpha [Acidobacteriota bacterium]
MLPREFVHLHLHTDYSLLDGANQISKLMDRAAEQGMKAMAMTDHGNMFGAVEFHKAAKAKGLNPIIGCEAYISQQGRHTRSESDHYNHLVLLCANQNGYQNLVKLVSAGYLEGFYYKPRMDKELLARHSEGLIALSGCLRGEINEALLAENMTEAARVTNQYRDIFGKENFFLEIQDQGLDQEKILNPRLVELSKRTDIPLVATNDAHYLRCEDAHAHDVLLCIQTGRQLSDEKRMRFHNNQFYVKSYNEMLGVFSEVPEAVWRTAEIASRCEVKIEKVKNPFPDFAVPSGESADSYFASVSREGFATRRPRLEELASRDELRHTLGEYNERLEREISMIQQMKFPGYFLIVWDFVRYAKQRGIPVGPGRGSAAGSLVSYALGITDIDPLEHNLLFERFLNPERISMPDIDIDFCQNRRGEVIEYVTQKYGRANVAQIITFGTMAAKAALKDVARAMEVPYGEADRIAKAVPNTLNISIEQAIEQSLQLADMMKADARVKEVVEVAKGLEGMVRHASTHAAGVVISPVPLTDVVPLYKTNKDEIVTQYDMNGLEAVGLLKMDFLGLTTLTVVDDAVKLIRESRGETLDLERIPYDDPETYQIFSKGLTSGVFQFESSGMRDILRRYQPTQLTDLTALNALYRPGPIQGGMVDDFIARKLGQKPVQYDLPELEQILSETLGVIVYQEQVMQIANLLAGYSLGQADLLRRAMGKKKAEEMAAQREQFVSGAIEKGFNKKKVIRIFDLMEQFAGYGFNKSHSAAYAALAYVTAYLKAHYPVEFMAALLTNEMGNTEKVVLYLNECREMAIGILPPDVQTGAWHFTPAVAETASGKAIRFGIGAIKNVGRATVDALIAARNEHGRFDSIFQFCEVIDPRSLNKRVIESMIKAGAMDSFGPRWQVFAVVDRALESGQRTQKARGAGQHDLFGGSSDAPAPPTALPSAKAWTETEVLTGEKEVLGFYITGHPMQKYAQKLRELGTVETNALADLPPQKEVAIGGVLTAVKAARSKRGDLWASGSLEDLQGKVDLLVFPEAYKRFAELLKMDAILLVRGKLQMEEGASPRLNVSDVGLLDKAEPEMASAIIIRIRLGRQNGSSDSAVARQLFDLIERKPGAALVRIELEREGDFEALLELEHGVRPDEEFKSLARGICGKDSLVLV